MGWSVKYTWLERILIQDGTLYQVKCMIYSNVKRNLEGDGDAAEIPYFNQA